MAPLPKPVDLDEVNRLAELGRTNAEIAAALGISKVHLWRSGFRRERLPTADSIDWEVAQALLDEGSYMADVASHFGVSEKTLRRRRQATGLPALKVAPRFGDRAPAWKSGRWTTKRGYVAIKCPDHPQATSGGYVMEHRLVMEEALGRFLTREEVVHHINDIKDDNRLENLELFPNNGAHISATRKGIRRGVAR